MASVILVTKNRPLVVNNNLSEAAAGLNYTPLLLLLFSLAGFVGNLLVCIAIRLDTRLQSATNYYLFSLAIVDMLVSVLIIPMAVLQIVVGNLTI